MNEFTTTEGIKLKIRPVAQRKLAMLFANRRKVSPPTYEIKSVGGEVSILEHDSTTLETAEDRAAWAEYEQNLALANLEFTERWVAMILSDGVIFEMPEDGEWRKRQEWQGIAIPEGEMDLKMHYLLTEVLRGENEVQALVDAIIALNHEKAKEREAAVTAVVDSFQPETQGKEAS